MYGRMGEGVCVTYVVLMGSYGQPMFFKSRASGGPMMNQTRHPKKAFQFSSLEPAQAFIESSVLGGKAMSLADANDLVTAYLLTRVDEDGELPWGYTQDDVQK